MPDSNHNTEPVRAGAHAAVSLLVLDTNVVLDWLVFRDLRCGPFVDALEAGRAHWLATVAMRDELMHVLARGSLAAWQPDFDAIAITHRRLGHLIEASGTPSPPRLRCTDRDDQKFIDLAAQLGNACLLSRDRAVLKLARRAREAGFAILTPEAWSSIATGELTPQSAPAPARSEVQRAAHSLRSSGSD